MVKSDVLAGLVSGATQAALLNPWDRALYLSVTHRRAFLSASNFTHPYSGFGQAVVQRVISSGLYFVLQRQAEVLLERSGISNLQSGDRSANFLVGAFAGSCNGLLLNPLASIKYYSWGQVGWRWWGTTTHMWAQGGFVPFFKGASSTVSRDMIFGCMYEVSRAEFRRLLCLLPIDESAKKSKGAHMACNMLAATLATTASSPLNYVRNMKYASAAHDPDPSALSVFRDLRHETRKFDRTVDRVRYVVRCFRIGWGSARVGVGMGIGQLAFDFCRDFLAAAEEVHAT